MLTKRDLIRSAALAAMTASAKPSRRWRRRVRPSGFFQAKGHRRARLYLRPADRDELRRDARVRH